jgi:protein-export membrane protein SecD
MLNLARWRYVTVIIVTLLGILWALPNILPASVRAQYPAFLPNSTINLGLDLQGGSHLLFEVDKNAVFKQRLETVADDLTGALRGVRRAGELGARKPPIAFSGRGQSSDGSVVRVTITNASDLPEALDRISKLGQPVDGSNGLIADTDLVVKNTANNIEISLSPEAKLSMSRRAVTQSIEVIRRRIDDTGTKEPSITRQGADRIVVQAPGESDPEKLKSLIGQTAKLTFQLLDESVPVAEAMAGRIPPGSVLLPQPSRPEEPFVLVKRRAVVSGENLVDARPSFDQRTNQPVVSFRFDGAGSRAFGRVSTSNVGKRFAIILDDKIISAPNIDEPILGGSGIISGGFTVESAAELATLLRGGALPAPLTILEQRTVTAELGKDAVDAGAKAGVIAMVLVVIFMLLAYGFVFGGFSIIALCVNVTLIFAGMSAVGATLTLPGIAGLVLTLGMAVDANVLIYERMREEFAAGRSAALALDAGFSRAVVTIIDSHITSLLSALILFYFGSGPVRGFAWTLSLGILTSVFTAVLVSQVLIALWYRKTRAKVLPI